MSCFDLREHIIIFLSVFVVGIILILGLPSGNASFINESAYFLPP
jgi:hypothetical protein